MGLLRWWSERRARSFDEKRRQAFGYLGRARLITHFCDAWGEEPTEFSDSSLLPGLEQLLVFEFAPSQDRNWWTYSTAGLSLSPRMDWHPPTELVAYSETQARGLVSLLFQLSQKDETPGIYLRPGDTLSFEGDPPDLGVPLGRHYGFELAPEPAEVLQFPDLSMRPNDRTYVFARPCEDDTRLQLLRVVALMDSDRERWRSIRPELAATRAWRML
jgi:hypothetical protein